MRVRGLKLKIITFRLCLPSHPMRVRGLKQWIILKYLLIALVAPHAGAWIETVISWPSSLSIIVAPHAGAWIETAIKAALPVETPGRTPCGCVD